MSCSEGSGDAMTPLHLVITLYYHALIFVLYIYIIHGRMLHGLVHSHCIHTECIAHTGFTSDSVATLLEVDVAALEDALVKVWAC